MNGHISCYLVINAGQTRYYRYIKKYTDAQEKAFIVDAKMVEAGGNDNSAHTVRVGSIQRMQTEPKNAKEI